MVNFGKFLFGAPGRSVDPTSVRQLTLRCKEQGKVYDKETGECREKKPRGGNLVAARTARAAKRAVAGPTQADLKAACKARGMVFDLALKDCREKKARGRKAGSSALELAYNRGSLFFGVMPPPSAFRPGVAYHSPASKLLAPDYGTLGRVVDPTGPGSMLVAASALNPSMQAKLGVLTPRTPVATKKPTSIKKPVTKKA